MKGKENKAAECSSWLFPVIDPPGDETQKSDVENELLGSEIIKEYKNINNVKNNLSKDQFLNDLWNT